MSDATPTTPAMPDAGAGAPTTSTTPAVASSNGGPDGGDNQPGQPFAVFQTAESFNTRLQREARKELDNYAKAAGYDNWQALLDARNTQPPAPAAASAPPPSAPEPAATPTAPAPPSTPDEATRLRMALQVATEKGLPPALVARLQGNTPDEMAADADSLLALVQRPPAGPGIPPAPRNGQTVTFTRAQLRDPAFVREHATEIQRAAREGRIVDS